MHDLSFSMSVLHRCLKYNSRTKNKISKLLKTNRMSSNCINWQHESKAQIIVIVRNQGVELQVVRMMYQYIIISYFDQSQIRSRMISKRNWSQQQDDFLRVQGCQSQKKNWVEISKNFNEKFQGNCRTAKQCRQRFINHVSVRFENNFSNEWSQSNLNYLLELYEQWGPKWTLIASQMTNKYFEIKHRSENIVKNKFYCSLRKFVRKLNKNLKQANKKYKKQIKYESVVRILDAFESFTELPQALKTWSMQIRRKILQLTGLTIREQQFPDGMLEWLADNINKFNLQTRSYKAKRQKCIDSQESSEVKSFRKIPARFLENTQNYNSFAMNEKQSRQIQQASHRIAHQIESSINPENDCEEQGKTQLQLDLSEEQIFEDFGVSLSQKKNYSQQAQKNIYSDILPQLQCEHNFQDFY